jgi:hypothetical protein
MYTTRVAGYAVVAVGLDDRQLRAALAEPGVRAVIVEPSRILLAGSMAPGGVAIVSSARELEILGVDRVLVPPRADFTGRLRDRVTSFAETTALAAHG